MNAQPATERPATRSTGRRWARLVVPLAVAAFVAAACVPRHDEGFESGAIGTCWLQQEAAPDRLGVVDGPDGAGKALRVQVHANDTAIPADEGTGKSRAEIKMTQTCGDDYPAEVPIYYGWKVWFPSTWDIDSSTAFRIVGQFHHRGTGSPSVSFHLGLEGDQPVLQVKRRTSLTTPGEIVGSIPIQPDQWMHVQVRAVWSPDPAVGELEVRIDDVDLLGGTLAGPNSYDTGPKSWKLGLYRGQGVTTNDTMYYDDVRIGNEWTHV